MPPSGAHVFCFAADLPFRKDSPCKRPSEKPYPFSDGLFAYFDKIPANV
ncbi:hypothetical protein [Kingella potus]|nr:hypothetical protein [Kingella potus]UOP00921.1 hypothetical protein LVJ84_00400 [Kingella potus]